MSGFYRFGKPAPVYRHFFGIWYSVSAPKNVCKVSAVIIGVSVYFLVIYSQTISSRNKFESVIGRYWWYLAPWCIKMTLWHSGRTQQSPKDALVLAAETTITASRCFSYRYSSIYSSFKQYIHGFIYPRLSALALGLFSYMFYYTILRIHGEMSY